MSKAERIKRLPAALVAWWKNVLSPPPDETVVQWAGRAFDLSGESAEKGPFSVRRRPYMRKPLECHRDPRCRELVLCWGPQTGKTIVLYMGRFFRNRVFGYSALIVLPSIGYARKIAKSRILPLLRNSAVMKEIIPPHRHSITALEQFFTTCVNFITGSNSPANVAGSPMPDTVGDETDKFDEGSDKETSTPNLMRHRSITFPYSLNSWSSTPSHMDGFIWNALLASNFQKYMVNCPGCGKLHALTFEQFRHPADAKLPNGKWDLRRIMDETWHECPHGCGYHFKDADKHRLYASDSFVWVPTNDESMPGIEGFHLPSWYSPDTKCSFGAVRVRWLVALTSGKLADIQNFYNQDRAEPFDVQLATGGTVSELPRGSYEMGDPWQDEAKRLDNGKPVRVIVFDVQQDRLIYVCRTVGIGGATRLHSTGTVANFEEAEQVASMLGAGTVGIDCGYNMTVVLDECASRGWIPLRGEDRRGYPEKRPDGRVVTVKHRWQEVASASRGKVPVLFWATQGVQDDLAWLISGKGPSWTVSANPPEQYLKAMKSHRKTKKTGVYRWDVTSKGVDDHEWDDECMISVLMTAYEVIPQNDPETA